MVKKLPSYLAAIHAGAGAAKWAHDNRDDIKKGVKFVRDGVKYVQDTYHEYKRKRPAAERPRQQPAKRVRTARPGLVAAYSAGRGGPISKMPRMKKVKRKGRVVSALKHGVQLTAHRQISASNTDALYIGHTTHPTAYTSQVLYMALVKALFAKMSRPIPDLLAAIDGAVAGDSIAIFYRSTPAVVVDGQNFSFILAGVVQTPKQLAIAIASFFQGFSEELELTRISMNLGSGSVYQNCSFNMVNTRVEFFASSLLKLQNRTHESDGLSAESYDNDPVHGRGYEGKGNGTEYSVPGAQSSPIRGDLFGVITFGPAGTLDLRNPPYAQLFPQVSRSDKFTMGVGEVKTSYIQAKNNCTFSKFIGMTDTALSPDASYQKLLIGRFRFFGFSKLIRVSGSAALAYVCEVQQSLSCIVRLGQFDYTTKVFDIGTDASG